MNAISLKRINDVEDEDILNKFTAAKVGIIGINVGELLENPREIPIDTPFGAPSETIIEGEIEGEPCVVLSRSSRMKTFSPFLNCHANIWALQNLGVTHLIACYPCSSLRETMYPGDIVIPNNIINHSSWSNKIDINGAESLRCHMPMSPPFNDNLRNILIEAATDVNIPVGKVGTVLVPDGPRWPTSAECTMYRLWNADLVTLSQIVPDSTLSIHTGILYAPIVIVTNYGKWSPICTHKILDAYDAYMSSVVEICVQTVKNITSLNWDHEITTTRNRASIVILREEPTYNKIFM